MTRLPVWQTIKRHFLTAQEINTDTASERTLWQLDDLFWVTKKSEPEEIKRPTWADFKQTDTPISLLGSMNQAQLTSLLSSMTPKDMKDFSAKLAATERSLKNLLIDGFLITLIPGAALTPHQHALLASLLPNMTFNQKMNLHVLEHFPETQSRFFSDVERVTLSTDYLNRHVNQIHNSPFLKELLAQLLLISPQTEDLLFNQFRALTGLSPQVLHAATLEQQRAFFNQISMEDTMLIGPHGRTNYLVEYLNTHNSALGEGMLSMAFEKVCTINELIALHRVSSGVIARLPEEKRRAFFTEIATRLGNGATEADAWLAYLQQRAAINHNAGFAPTLLEHFTPRGIEKLSAQNQQEFFNVLARSPGGLRHYLAAHQNALAGNALLLHFTPAMVRTVDPHSDGLVASDGWIAFIQQSLKALRIDGSQVHGWVAYFNRYAHAIFNTLPTIFPIADFFKIETKWLLDVDPSALERHSGIREAFFKKLSTDTQPVSTLSFVNGQLSQIEFVTPLIAYLNKHPAQAPMILAWSQNPSGMMRIEYDPEHFSYLRPHVLAENYSSLLKIDAERLVGLHPQVLEAAPGETQRDIFTHLAQAKLAGPVKVNGLVAYLNQHHASLGNTAAVIFDVLCQEVSGKKLQQLTPDVLKIISATHLMQRIRLARKTTILSAKKTTTLFEILLTRASRAQLETLPPQILNDLSHPQQQAFIQKMVTYTQIIHEDGASRLVNSLICYLNQHGDALGYIPLLEASTVLLQQVAAEHYGDLGARTLERFASSQRQRFEEARASARDLDFARIRETAALGWLRPAAGQITEDTAVPEGKHIIVQMDGDRVSLEAAQALYRKYPAGRAVYLQADATNGAMIDVHSGNALAGQYAVTAHDKMVIVAHGATDGEAPTHTLAGVTISDLMKRLFAETRGLFTGTAPKKLSLLGCRLGCPVAKQAAQALAMRFPAARIEVSAREGWVLVDQDGHRHTVILEQSGRIVLLQGNEIRKAVVTIEAGADSRGQRPAQTTHVSGPKDSDMDAIQGVTAAQLLAKAKKSPTTSSSSFVEFDELDGPTKMNVTVNLARIFAVMSARPVVDGVPQDSHLAQRGLYRVPGSALRIKELRNKMYTQLLAAQDIQAYDANTLASVIKAHLGAITPFKGGIPAALNGIAPPATTGTEKEKAADQERYNAEVYRVFQQEMAKYRQQTPENIRQLESILAKFHEVSVQQRAAHPGETPDATN